MSKCNMNHNESSFKVFNCIRGPITHKLKMVPCVLIAICLPESLDDVVLKHSATNRSHKN
jgi:hypothetical protein